MSRTSSDPSDVAALERVRQGDVDAFRHFLDAYGPHVERIVARHLPDQAGPDGAQEVFVKAYGSLPSYDAQRPFGHWLTTIAMRCCYDRLRKVYANRELTGMDEDAHDWLDRAARDGAPDAMTEQEQWEARQVLERALDAVAPLDRMILRLTVIDGYTAVEAAEMLELTTVNVRVRAFRAKRRLKSIILELMEETA